jgi:hypothetical protein
MAIVTIRAAAGDVNFANDAFANQGPRSRCPGAFVYSFNDADKFVSQDSLESQVATRDFEVGVADAGLEDADEGFP